MMRMLGRLENQLGVRVQTAAFLQNPTLQHCLDLLQAENEADELSCIVPLTASTDTHYAREPFFCTGGAGGGVHRFAALARASALDRPFYGLDSQALPEELRSNFSIETAAEYFLSAIRGFQPVGPYFLGGYSLGGLIAIEIAQRLVDIGECIHPVVLIDTYPYAGNRSQLERVLALVPRLLTSPVSDSRSFVKAAVRRRVALRQSSAGRLPALGEIEAERHIEVAAALRYMSGFTQCRVPVRVVLSKYGSRLAPRGADRGWSHISVPDLALFSVPGDHFSILYEPHVIRLGVQLKQLLDGR